MPDAKPSFDDFLLTVEDDNKAFALEINEKLIADNYKTKIELKANGYLVSYSHPKTRRSILNFVFRGNKLCVRMYADKFSKYESFINSLPEPIEKEIAKSAACKRLLNPGDCNPRCVAGYDIIINGNRYVKCRYDCFLLMITPENSDIIKEFIENERMERSGG